MPDPRHSSRRPACRPPAIRRCARSLAGAALLLAAALAAGCGAKAAADVPGPPLAVPAPPARVVTPVEPVPLAAAPGRTETPLAPVPELVAPSPPVRPAPVAGAPRQEPAAPPPPAAPPVVEPTREVRTGSTAEEEAFRKETERLLATASAVLNRVNRQNLSSLMRQQYDDSRSLTEVARKALAERNFPYALTNARKAAQLAEALGIR